MSCLGFLDDPKQWVGKTIAMVEVLAVDGEDMSKVVTLFKFTNAERGWLTGGRARNGANFGPRLEAVLLSQIVTNSEKQALRDALKLRVSE